MKKLVLLLIFLLTPFFASAVPCDISLSITSNKETFENNNKIEFYNKLNNKSFDFVIEYWVEDTKGNLLKRKIKTTNMNKKTFTPKNINKPILLKSRILSLGCDDLNLTDNFAEKKLLPHNYSTNSTHNTINIYFKVDKDMQKLKNLANQLKQPEEKESKTTSNTQNNKLKEKIPYFLVALTTLISIVLVWRR